MAIGPGVLAVAAVLLVLLLLAVIGLVSGGDEGGKSARKTDTTGKKKPGKKRQTKKQAAPAAPPSTVKVKIAPTEPTYVCVDDGHRTIFEATITSAHSFREKRVRVNLGRPSARISVNGKPFHYDEGAEAVGFSFSRTGRASRLPLGDRPCA